jgi:hypothetical protein
VFDIALDEHIAALCSESSSRYVLLHFPFTSIRCKKKVCHIYIAKKL